MASPVDDSMGEEQPWSVSEPFLSRNNLDDYDDVVVAEEVLTVVVDGDDEDVVACGRGRAMWVKIRWDNVRWRMDTPSYRNILPRPS